MNNVIRFNWVSMITYTLILTITLSCNTAGNNHSLPLKLTLKYPINQKYYYTLSNQVQTTAEVSDKKVESLSKADIGLIYEFSKDTGANYLLKITYDKIHVTLKDAKGSQEMDADKASTSIDPVEKILGTLKGATLVVTLSEKGEVLSVSGSKEISDRLLAGMNQLDQYTRQAAPQLISQFAGELFVKNNLSQGFNVLPDSAIHVGDTWTKKSTQTANISFEANTRYELTSIENGVAEIESSSTISNIKNLGINLGYNMQADITGTQTGKISADTATGLLIKEKTTTKMQGVVEVLGREVPMKINLQREMSGRKL